MQNFRNSNRVSEIINFFLKSETKFWKLFISAIVVVSQTALLPPILNIKI